MIIIKITEREFAHVLAGLRMLQWGAHWAVSPTAAEVLYNYLPDGHGPLTDKQIDALCERLN